MTFNMFNYINGSVKVKVSGAMPEKFINLCVTQNIFLWGITKKNDDLVVCMRLADFFCIRPLVRISQSHVQVIGYWGLPFLNRKIKRRKMMVIGGIIFLIVLNVLVSYIWFIDIVGMKSIPANQIREIVYNSGLKPGVLKENLNTKFIENQILLNIPETAWVGINFKGIHAVVEIVEKTMPKQQDKAPAHIIAAKDGVITEIIALSGQSVVKKGDTVKKGDLLIKGVSCDGGVANSNVTALVPQLIRANGIVKARVWYESYGETELVKLIYERTGVQKMGVVLRINQYELVLKQAPADLNHQFEVEVINKKLPWWRNSDVAVESIISNYHEINAKMVELSVEEARNQGKANALALVQSLIPETAQILSRNIEVLQIADTNLVRVKVSVETVEDIGQFMNIP